MNQSPLFDDIDNVLPKIYEIYNKTEDEVNQDIDTVTTWLKMQPHLPETMKKSHIRNFLFMNKFCVEKTKEKIDNYYTVRSIMPHLFKGCNPKLPKMKKVLEETMYIGIYPQLYKGLHRVYLYKIKAPDVHMAKETMLTLANVKEISLQEDYIFSDIHVVDLANLTLSDATKYTLSIIMDILTVVEKVYSFPSEAYHVINAPSFVLEIVKILKMFVQQKFFEKLHISSDDAILNLIFTLDTLPKDYGGKGPSLQELTDITVTKFEEYASRFDELDEMRVDETLRPEKLVDDEYLAYHRCLRN